MPIVPTEVRLALYDASVGELIDLLYGECVKFRPYTKILGAVAHPERSH